MAKIITSVIMSWAVHGGRGFGEQASRREGFSNCWAALRRVWTRRAGLQVSPIFLHVARLVARPSSMCPGSMPQAVRRWKPCRKFETARSSLPVARGRPNNTGGVLPRTILPLVAITGPAPVLVLRLSLVESSHFQTPSFLLSALFSPSSPFLLCFSFSLHSTLPLPAASIVEAGCRYFDLLSLDVVGLSTLPRELPS